MVFPITSLHPRALKYSLKVVFTCTLFYTCTIQHLFLFTKILNAHQRGSIISNWWWPKSGRSRSRSRNMTTTALVWNIQWKNWHPDIDILTNPGSLQDIFNLLYWYIIAHAQSIHGVHVLQTTSVFFSPCITSHIGVQKSEHRFTDQSDTCSSDCDTCRLVNKCLTERIHIPILCNSFPTLKIELNCMK